MIPESRVSNQGSAAFNLWNKLEWMSRELRKIDDAAAIQQWITAMNKVFKFMQEVAKIKEVYIDGWKPWQCSGQSKQHLQRLKKRDKTWEATKAVSNQNEKTQIKKIKQETPLLTDRPVNFPAKAATAKTFLSWVINFLFDDVDDYSSY